MKSYVIHYTRRPERLAHMQEVCEILSLDYTVVRGWDSDDLTFHSLVASNHLWAEQIEDIKHILIANTIHGGLDYKEKLKISVLDNRDHPWLRPKALGPGEISVLFKHYYALSTIAEGTESFGMIMEDDIFLKPSSVALLRKSIAAFTNSPGNYLDVAGGAGLLPDIGQELSRDSLNNIIQLDPPRTRTNACYIISKALAKEIVSLYFPLCLPIDWHLQRLFLKVSNISCFWTIEEPLIHGSENGLIKSWRL